MWEGMERFLKQVELIGRASTQGLEYQMKSEELFATHDKEIQLRLLISDYEARMSIFRAEMESKINSGLKRLDNELSTQTKRLDGRIDDLSSKLDKVERDTVSKIKECEQLLQQRPTIGEVKELIGANGKVVKENSMEYTDNAIKKYAKSDNSTLITINKVRDDLLKRIEKCDKELNRVETEQDKYRDKNDTQHHDIEQRLLELLRNNQDEVLKLKGSIGSGGSGGNSLSNEKAMEEIAKLWEAVHNLQNKCKLLDEHDSVIHKLVKNVKILMDLPGIGSQTNDGPATVKFDDADTKELERALQLLTDRTKQLEDKFLTLPTFFHLEKKADKKDLEMWVRRMDGKGNLDASNLVTRDELNYLHDLINKLASDLKCIEVSLFCS